MVARLLAEREAFRERLALETAKFEERLAHAPAELEGQDAWIAEALKCVVEEHERSSTTTMETASPANRRG